jgi:uncharacterized protein with gpF-like domain
MARRLVDQNRQREQRRQSRLLDALSERFEGRLNAIIARAMNDMIDKWRLTGEVVLPPSHHEQVEEAFRQMVTASAITFGERIRDQGKALGHTLERKEDFAAIMGRMALQYIAGEMVRRRITNIAETTRSQTVAAIAQGFAEGLGQDGVADYVRAKVPQYSLYRSRMIARTETHGAANFGAMQAANQTGLPLQKEWIAAQDERTRVTHQLADGQIVDSNSAFDVGGASLMYPGDPSGPAEEVINCRCALGYIVQEDTD